MEPTEKTPLTEAEKQVEKLNDYRKTLVEQIISDEKEYHSTVTYLAAGGLALFLTINEKFFDVVHSRQFWAFVLSLALLFFTLVLYIVNTMSDIRSNERLRDVTDGMIRAKHYNKPQLLADWDAEIKKSRWLTYFRMVTLSLGIFFEILFIVANLGTVKEEKKGPAKIEISIPVHDSTNIMLDTSNKALKLNVTNQ